MEAPKHTEPETKRKRTLVGSLLVGLFGTLGAVYLVNPGAGFIELIPDNLPVIGNLDEAAATMLVISALAYFGVDLGGLFGRKRKRDGVIDVEVEEER